MGHVRKIETRIRRERMNVGTHSGACVKSIAGRWRQGLPAEFLRPSSAVNFEVLCEQHAWMFLDPHVDVQRADFFPYCKSPFQIRGMHVRTKMRPSCRYNLVGLGYICYVRTHGDTGWFWIARVVM